MRIKGILESFCLFGLEKKTVCGFYTGCNVILTAIRDIDFRCDGIILQSPWIPVVEEGLTDMIKKLKEKVIDDGKIFERYWIDL